MKISQLPEPYKSLAEKRRAEDERRPVTDDDDIDGAFYWEFTKEGHDFWGAVDDARTKRKLPHIPQQSLEELDMNWKQGDIITNGEHDRKILGVCGELVFVSLMDAFDVAASFNHTRQELEEHGWRLKTEPTEMTVKDIAKKLTGVCGDGAFFDMGQVEKIAKVYASYKIDES